jgi:galactose oxidase
MCLNINGASTSSGAQLIQWPCQAASQTNDQWILTQQGGAYHISSVKSGMCVNISGASTASGANAIQWACQPWGSTYNNDQFSFVLP